eukprot:5443105-Amphidinium_carterae.2
MVVDQTSETTLYKGPILPIWISFVYLLPRWQTTSTHSSTGGFKMIQHCPTDTSRSLMQADDDAADRVYSNTYNGKQISGSSAYQFRACSLLA